MVKDDGNDINTRLVQPIKAYSPIRVTDSGKDVKARLVHL